MATVKPFKAWRPTADKVHLVATRSVDRYKKNELNAKMQDNPYTFFHVIMPFINQTVKPKIGSIEHLTAIKNKFQTFCENKILLQDKTATFYIYEQINSNYSCTGIIGLASITDYLNNVIKKHENTIADREQKLKNYLEVCDFNAEPVCISYPKNNSVNQLISKIKLRQPDNDFTTTDTLRHKLWVVNIKSEVEQIELNFENIKTLYIADGHHRSASSALLAQQKKQSNSKHSENDSYNYYMAIFFQEQELKIFEFNRLVKDLNGLSSKEFLEYLKNDFVVKETQTQRPNKAFEFTMYLNKRWYSLRAKEKIIDIKDGVNSLDAAILTNNILDPILGIKDQRTDRRIQFVGGLKGTKELIQQVDSGKFQVAFVLYPATMEQVIAIADCNGVMPPKTTWVEPKLRSGLTIYSLS